MSDLQLVHFRSLDHLMDRCADWNDLWQRSSITSPTTRAELLALWIRHFTPAADFHGLAVERNGRLLAAIPLVSKELSGLVDVGGMPTSAWCACGDLLLDPGADATRVMRELVNGFDQLPWPLLWLDGVPIDTDRWVLFQQVANDFGMSTYADSRFDIPRIQLAASWEEYRQSWSRNHRRNVRRSWDKLRRRGVPEYEVHTALSPEQVEPIVMRALATEQRSWKALSGATILNTPGMAKFFVRQSQLLAKQSQLDIAFLNLDGRPIAHDLGWSAKGVYHSIKVSYDAQYAEFSPGSVLLARQLERFHQTDAFHSVDGMGPISELFKRWHPNTYRLGRLLIARHQLWSRLLLSGYQRLWPTLRRCRAAAGF